MGNDHIMPITMIETTELTSLDKSTTYILPVLPAMGDPYWAALRARMPWWRAVDQIVGRKGHACPDDSRKLTLALTRLELAWLDAIRYRYQLPDYRAALRLAAGLYPAGRTGGGGAPPPPADKLDYGHTTDLGLVLDMDTAMYRATDTNSTDR